MYEDKTLICKECGKEFVFTAGEQEFYASKGFENEPQRCKACRQNRKNAAKPEREMYTAVCAACGKEATVPFKPREYRLLQRVLCTHEGRKISFKTHIGARRETAGHFAVQRQILLYKYLRYLRGKRDIPCKTNLCIV